MDEYSISKIFAELEDELISNMVKNMKKHMKDEKIENIGNWEQWQTLQLKALQDFRKRNKEILPAYEESIMKKIETLLKTSYRDAGLKQERDILKSILDGARPNPNKEIKDILKNVKGKNTKQKVQHILESNGTFFKIDDKKLNALIEEAKAPLKDVTKSILRYEDDVYRQVIYKSVVASNTGVKSVYAAVDLATKDFLSRGVTSIKFKNGATWNIEDYSLMAIRTANKRAKLMGEGQVRDEWNEHLVLTSQYGACSKICLPHQNHLFIDDVYSNGKPDGKHKMLSSAVAAGLFHPSCRHTISTFFEGINTIPPRLNDATVTENSELEQQQRALEREQRKWQRLKNGSLDDANKRKYELKEIETSNKLNKLIKDSNGKLRRDPWRETTQLKETPKPIKDVPGLLVKDEPESIGDILKNNPPKKEEPKPIKKEKSTIERLKDKGITIEGRFGFDGEGNREYILEQIDDLSNRYNLNNKLTLRSRYTDDNTGAYYEHSRDMSTSRINLNKRIFNNFEFLDAIEEAGEKSGWCVKTSGKEQLRRKTIVHEYGHLVQRELVNKNFNLDSSSPTFFKEYTSICNDLMNEFRSMFRKEIGRELQFKKDLSTYAMTDSKEFFAEAFCKMECNSPDDDVARVMNLFLKKYNMIKE